MRRRWCAVRWSSKWRIISGSSSSPRCEHFLIRNLADVLGEKLVTDIDFRPMPRRIMPQRAESARPAGGIEDPVLDLLYRRVEEAKA